MPQTMKMPIVIYDHLNDDMLFEYVLGTKLSMYDESDTSGNAWKVHVETQLGEDGTPVYKKATVIQLAKDLKEYLIADKKQLGITRRFPRPFTDEIWKYEITLRKYEYWMNRGEKNRKIDGAGIQIAAS